MKNWIQLARIAWTRSRPLARPSRAFAGGLHRSCSVGLTAFAAGKSFSPFPKWLKSQAAQVTRGKTYGRSVEPIK